MYEDEHVVVEASPIEGHGVFAKHDFKNGKVVLTWNPLKKITIENRDSISVEEKERYVSFLDDGTEILMGFLERYVNHSCDPNTNPINATDVAIRDIKIGEEITANYLGEHIEFECRGCGSTNCKSA